MSFHCSFSPSPHHFTAHHHFHQLTYVYHNFTFLFIFILFLIPYILILTLNISLFFLLLLLIHLTISSAPQDTRPCRFSVIRSTPFFMSRCASVAEARARQDLWKVCQEYSKTSYSLSSMRLKAYTKQFLTKKCFDLL